MVPEPAAIAAGATGAAGAAGAAGATGTAPATPADALLAAWRAAGGAESELGRVTSGELSLSDGVGRGLVCKEGAVLWHPARGAFALAGSLFHTWTRMGAEGGPLGYPVTPEHRVTEGAWSARLVRFERGLIVDWMHAGAEDLPPFAILDGDALYQTWLSAGAEQGPAGVPVGVPQELSNTTIRLLPCSDGAVVWMAGRGTAVLDREQYQTWCASLGRG